MKHGNKNRSNTRKILNNSNVHTHARRHARAYPPLPPYTHTHSISLTHTHTHTQTKQLGPFHKSKAPKSRYKWAKQILLITATVN